MRRLHRIPNNRCLVEVRKNNNWRHSTQKNYGNANFISFDSQPAFGNEESRNGNVYGLSLKMLA